MSHFEEVQSNPLEVDEGLDFRRFLHDWTLSSTSLLQSDGSVFSPQSCFSSNDSELDCSRVSASSSPDSCTNTDIVTTQQHVEHTTSSYAAKIRKRPLQPYPEDTNNKLRAVITVPATMEQGSTESPESCVRACDSCRVTSAEHKRRRMERRREQNRASQRRFRAGKEAKIRDAEEHSKNLEQRLQQMELHAGRLQFENLALRDKLESLGGMAQGHPRPILEDTITDRHLHLSLFDHELDPGNR